MPSIHLPPNFPVFPLNSAPQRDQVSNLCTTQCGRALYLHHVILSAYFPQCHSRNAFSFPPIPFPFLPPGYTSILKGGNGVAGHKSRTQLMGNGAGGRQAQTRVCITTAQHFAHFLARVPRSRLELARVYI